MPGLEDLYREIILDHYRNPRNRGELEPRRRPHRVEGFNPLCGDEIVVYLDVDDAKGDDAVVTDIRIGGQGCSISQSSASMMSAAVKGKTVAEVEDLTQAFKAMMSIHESGLESGDAEPRRRRSTSRRQARRPRGAARRGEVPGAHQVRHPVLEHPGPGPRRSRRPRVRLTRLLVPRPTISNRTHDTRLGFGVVTPDPRRMSSSESSPAESPIRRRARPSRRVRRPAGGR